MSSFAIRFKPSAIADDDDDDDLDTTVFGGSQPLKKETVLFERTVVTATPLTEINSDSIVSDPSQSQKCAQQDIISVAGTQTMAPLLQTDTSYSKASPDLSISAKDCGKDAATVAEKSIFSGWKEKLDRLSAESKEMFERKMRRSGSADAAKIQAMLNGSGDSDGKGVATPELESRSADTKLMQIPKGNSASLLDHGETDNHSITDSCEDIPTSAAPSLMHKSASVGMSQQLRKECLINEASHWTKRSSVATEYELVKSTTDSVSMSKLLTSNDDDDDEDDELNIIPHEVEQMQLSTSDTSFDDNDCHSSEGSSLQGSQSRLSHFQGILQKWRNYISVVVGLIAYILIPLPTYISGFVTGSLTTVFLTFMYHYLIRSSAKSDERTKLATKSNDVKSVMPLSVPKSPNLKQVAKSDNKFKGWMNELPRYDVDDYHINQTHSVYVTLEGTTLRLQTPKHGIPKRAFTDEQIPPVAFVRQRHFDLRGASIYLLPSDLVSKRLWSKKYPICIELDKPSRNKMLELSCKDMERLKSRSAVSLSGSMESLAKKGVAEVDDIVEKDKLRPILYLFARSCRDKEEWYRRFVAASRGTPWPVDFTDRSNSLSRSTSPEKHGTPMSVSPAKHHRSESIDSTGSGISIEMTTKNSEVVEVDYGKMCPEQNLAEYVRYMSRLMPAAAAASASIAPAVQSGTSATDSEPVSSDSEANAIHDLDVNTIGISCTEPSLVWLNALIGRCFMDFLREKYWAEKICEKIQKKLCKMHVPHFIEKLTVTGIELGSSVPSICRVSPPFLDDRGLWVDLEIAYSGGFCISMATKCNLMKLKQTSFSVNDESQTATKDKKSAVTHSDEEDSAESTTDEENVEENSVADSTEDKRTEPMGKKLLRFVDKISQSKYFQQATEYKWLKKAMEEVSNTLLVLNVEVCSITGTLAVNIPPPPSDRLWYGFRGTPEIVLSAKPYVGDREVSLSPVTEWIEKKLAIEFQRVFVMPNMDDVPLPLLCAHL